MFAPRASVMFSPCWVFESCRVCMSEEGMEQEIDGVSSNVDSALVCYGEERFTG